MSDFPSSKSAMKSDEPASDGKEASAPPLDGRLQGTQEFESEDAPASGWSKRHLDTEQHFIIHAHWSPTRRKMAKWMKTAIFRGGVPVLILLSFCMSIADVELRARGSEAGAWMHILEKCLLVIFAVELCLRFYVHRTSFFRSPWNLIDFAVVSVDIAVSLLEAALDQEGPSASLLRIFRVFRMIRISKVLVDFRELYVIVYGIAAALKAIFWGLVLILIVFVIYGILAVEIIQPLNQEIANLDVYDECERCPRAYSNIGQSILTFFQTIVAGDSWGTYTVPIMERHPWTSIIFIGVLASVQMGLMNLVLMVIVDCATDARAEDVEFQNEKRQEQYAHMRTVFDGVCRELDEDGNGQLTLDELLKGAAEDEDFANILKMMDISFDELGAVFNILDSDRSGSISHSEFVQQLYKMKTADSQTMITLLKYDVLTMEDRMMSEMKGIKQQLDKQHQDMNNMLRKMVPAFAGCIDRESCNPEAAESLGFTKTPASPESWLPLGFTKTPDSLAAAGFSSQDSSGQLVASDPEQWVLDVTCKCAQIEKDLQGCAEQISLGMAATIDAATCMRDRMGMLEDFQRACERDPFCKAPPLDGQEYDGQKVKKIARVDIDHYSGQVKKIGRVDIDPYSACSQQNHEDSTEVLSPSGDESDEHRKSAHGQARGRGRKEIPI